MPPAAPPGSAGGPPPPGQPPMGSSPATGPSQNLGMAAKGLQAAGALLNAMAMVIPLVGAGSPLGQALAKGMTDIGKHIPPGTSSPQGEQQFAQQMLMKQRQMASQRAAVGSQMPGAGGPTGAGAPGAGAPPPSAPPMAA